MFVYKLTYVVSHSNNIFLQLERQTSCLQEIYLMHTNVLITECLQHCLYNIILVCIMHIIPYCVLIYTAIGAAL